MIRTFISGGSYTANEVAELIGLSRQTVKKSIQFFIESGLIVSEGKGSSTSSGGKRPEVYTFNKEKYFICITLWPHEIQLNLYNIGNWKIDSLIQSSVYPDDPKKAIDTLGHLALELLDKNQIQRRNVCAVSLSTSGIINYKTGELRFNSQAPSWGNDIPLRDYLKSYFSDDTLIFLENTGKMMARPYLLDHEYDDKRLLSIFSGWGLSGCLIDKGHVLGGKNSLIGEIGHMVIDVSDSELCGCGRHGCLERLVSPDRIRSLISKKLKEHPVSVFAAKELDRINATDIFEASAEGDPIGRELDAYLASCFAIAISNISVVFDPEYIIFQGDYAFADKYFDEMLKNKLFEFKYFPENNALNIRYDRRDLKEMDALGSYVALSHKFFSSVDLH